MKTNYEFGPLLNEPKIPFSGVVSKVYFLHFTQVPLTVKFHIGVFLSL